MAPSAVMQAAFFYGLLWSFYGCTDIFLQVCANHLPLGKRCVNAFAYNLMLQYMALVLGVQRSCTESTKAMYWEYKAHVLPPEDASGKKREFFRSLYVISLTLTTVEPEVTVSSETEKGR